MPHSSRRQAGRSFLTLLALLALSLACGRRPSEDQAPQGAIGLPGDPRSPVAQTESPPEVGERVHISEDALRKMGVEVREAAPRPMIDAVDLHGEVVGDEARDVPGAAIPPDRNRVIATGQGPVFVRVQVPSHDLARVRVGQEARVEARAMSRNVTGHVVSVGSMAGQPTRAAPVRIAVPSPGGRWWPGLSVAVRLVKESFTAALAVPQAAILSHQNGPAVYVRSDDGFEVRAVTVGRSDEGWVEILSGLAAGERFAATNSFAIGAATGRAAPIPHP